MDHPTSSFYATYATSPALAAESSRSAMMAAVERVFRAGDRVLDVGAGSGRDVAAMLAMGIAAYGVEPHARMRDGGVALRPELKDRLRDGAMPALGQPFRDQCPDGFDGVICSAVLMHIAPDVLPQTLAALAAPLRAIRPDDTPDTLPALLLAIPAMDADRLRDDRDPDGRAFHNHAPATIEQQLRPHGLRLAASTVSDAVLASAGTRWFTLVFRRA